MQIKHEKLTNLSFNQTDDYDFLSLIKTAKAGVDFNDFLKINTLFRFNQSEWSNILGITTRTFQKKKKENGVFNRHSTEILVKIIMLYNFGVQIFENNELFLIWLKRKNVALNNQRPIDLLESTFGIDAVKDELNRIFHGVFA